MSLPLASTTVSHWEELRRSARKLENDLDSKLTLFSQFLSNTTNKNDEASPKTFEDIEDTEAAMPLIDSKVDHFEQLSLDINSLILSLGDVIQKMEALDQISLDRLVECLEWNRRITR